MNRLPVIPPGLRIEIRWQEAYWPAAVVVQPVAVTVPVLVCRSARRPGQRPAARRLDLKRFNP